MAINPFLQAAGYQQEDDDEKKKKKGAIASKPSQVAAQENKKKQAAETNPFLNAITTEKQNKNSIYSERNQPQATQSQQPVQQPQKKTVLQNIQGAATTASNVVRSATDAIGLTKPKTNEQLATDQGMQQLALNDPKKYAEIAITPALYKRIKDIDDLIATGKPKETKIVPDVIPGLPEEKIANKVIELATGKKNSEDALLKEREYLQSLINGDVKSLAYQRKQVAEGKMTQDAYDKLINDQRVNALRGLQLNRKADAITRGAASSTAGFADFTQLKADEYKVDSPITGKEIQESGVILGGLNVIGKVVKKASRMLGGDKVADAVGEKAAVTSENLNKWADLTRDGNETFADKIAEGIGSTLPFMAIGGVVGKATAVLSNVSPAIASWFAAGASGAIEAGTEAGSAYKQNLADGKPKEEAMKSADQVFWGNVGLNIFLDRYGIQDLDEASRLKKFFLSGASEGVQELSQQVISNVNTGRPFDEGVIESGVIGMIVGSGLSNISPTLSEGEAITSDQLAENPFIQSLPADQQQSLLSTMQEGEKKVQGEAVIAGQSFDYSQPIVREKVVTPTGQKLESTIQNYVKDSGVFFDTEGKPQVTPSLRELEVLAEDPEVQEVTRRQVEQLQKNDDGTITLYRGGMATDGIANLQSATYDKNSRLVSAAFTRESAENFVTENAGDNRQIFEFKAKPEDIKIFIGGTEAEVLVPGTVINPAKIKTAAEAVSGLSALYSQDEDGAVATAHDQILAELEISAPGERIFNDDGEFIGSTGSTFPTWIPEELRSSKLFKSVLADFSDLSNLKYPPNSQPRKQALYDELLAQLDSRSGKDSSSIIEEIKGAYAREKPTKETKSAAAKADSSTTGSTGTGKSEVAEKVVSTPESREKGADKPVTTPGGKEKKSKAYQNENVQDRLTEEFRDDPSYTSLKIAEESAKAQEFVEKFPEQAVRIAQGFEKPPEGFTDTAISIAASEKAYADGNTKLFSQLESARSLRQTRRGQEIVMEKGRVNQNSAHHFVAQVMKARLEAVSKVRALIWEANRDPANLKKSKAQKAVEYIDKKADALKKKIDKQTLSKLESAQSILDKLTCKI